RRPGLPRRRAPPAFPLGLVLAGQGLFALVRDRDRLMAVFVCLVRAIGPATHAVMSMADLRAGCEAAGLEDVATHGNTGNVVCRSRKSPHTVRRLVQGVIDGF